MLRGGLCYEHGAAPAVSHRPPCPAERAFAVFPQDLKATMPKRAEPRRLIQLLASIVKPVAAFGRTSASYTSARQVEPSLRQLSTVRNVWHLKTVCGHVQKPDASSLYRPEASGRWLACIVGMYEHVAQLRDGERFARDERRGEPARQHRIGEREHPLIACARLYGRGGASECPTRRSNRPGERPLSG